jgi:2-oxoisovalerate dehydrogenase E1 component alpha subunit
MRKTPIVTSERNAFPVEDLPGASYGGDGRGSGAHLGELPIRQVLDWDGGYDERAEPELSVEELHGLYRAMLRVRALDTKAMNFHRQGRIGFYVPSFGEEAAQIGSAYALAANDWIYPAYREQGAALLRGYPLDRLVSQFLGNAEDYGKGRQMPNHFGSPAVRFAVASSPVGTQIIHAVGAAYGCRLRGEEAIVLTYFGDGATSTGDFHAGMNFAAVWNAPIVFFCKNNGYAISLPVARQTKSGTLAEKAWAYGMGAARVDGNDLLAVYQVTKEAVERARGALEGEHRRGGGPTLIEAITFRMGPHSSADDPNRYREAAECEAWKARDPISRFCRYLERKGIWSEAQDAEARKEIEAEVNAVFREAEKLPPPPLESLVEDVYADMPWHLQEQLQELRSAMKGGEQ